MSDRSQFTSIDDYLASVPTDVRRTSEEIRQVVKARVPEAIETIGYKMPAFGIGKIFFYFAVFKRHIGFYSIGLVSRALQVGGRPLRGSAGFRR